MEILVYSASQIENFGGPSLINGLDEILAEIFPDCSVVCLDNLIKRSIRIEDNKIIKQVIPNKIPSKSKFLINALTYRVFRMTLFDKCEVFSNLVKANVLINATGIQFCDNLGISKTSWEIKLLPSVQIIDAGAKILGKKLISYTKSYGPVLHSRTRNSLKVHGKWLYDLLLCREKNSQQVLIESGINSRKILATYDSGIMMTSKEFNLELVTSNKFIIFSVSFQIIRQWKNNDKPYIELIEHLIKYILLNYDYDIILLPNEFKENDYDDLDVAEDIIKYFPSSQRIKIFDIRMISAKNVKYLISKSVILIGSRYHSIIAALSSNIPTLVIGWHYKYFEIMEKYQMLDYLIRMEECNDAYLFRKVDELITDHEKIKMNLSTINPDVKMSILSAGFRLREIIMDK
jgi:polysaccharide pyruvyl transferase WcaK-like protein